MLVWDARVTDPHGIPVGLDEFIRRELHAGDAYDGEPGPRHGVQVLEPARTLALPGEPPVRVAAL